MAGDCEKVTRRFQNLICGPAGASQCHGGFEVEAGENPSRLAAKTMSSRITKPDIRQQL
jgi:hypothetical protein